MFSQLSQYGAHASHGVTLLYVPDHFPKDAFVKVGLEYGDEATYIYVAI